MEGIGSLKPSVTDTLPTTANSLRNLLDFICFSSLRKCRYDLCRIVFISGLLTRPEKTQLRHNTV